MVGQLAQLASRCSTQPTIMMPDVDARVVVRRQMSWQPGLTESAMSMAEAQQVNEFVKPA